MDDLSTQILGSDVDVDCPACSFCLWVRMSEIIAQVEVLCPSCRTWIHLIDERGAMTTAGDVMESMIMDSLKGFF